MVREIRGAKINPKSSFKNYGAQNMRGRKLREQIRYCRQVLIKLEFSPQIFENTQIQILCKPCYWSRVVPCGQTDGWTDRRDEANWHFSQF
jgi:hypothetical protein